MLAILNPIGNVPIFLQHVSEEPLEVQKNIARLMSIKFGASAPIASTTEVPQAKNEMTTSDSSFRYRENIHAIANWIYNQ